MLINDMNMFKHHTFDRFLQRFSLPTCTFPMCRLKNGQKVQTGAMHTREDMVDHFKSRRDMVPDFCIRLGAASIHSHSDTKNSEIVCEISIFGT